MCKDLKLVDSVLIPPGYSPVTPKPMYESPNAQVYWDGPVYADHTCVKANRVDAPLVDHKRNEVWGGGESRKADEKKIAVLHSAQVHDSVF